MNFRLDDDGQTVNKDSGVSVRGLLSDKNPSLNLNFVNIYLKKLLDATNSPEIIAPTAVIIAGR